MKHKPVLLLTIGLCLALILGACQGTRATPAQTEAVSTSTAGGAATGLPNTGGTATLASEPGGSATAGPDLTGTPAATEAPGTTPLASATAMGENTTGTPAPEATGTVGQEVTGTVTTTVTASPAQAGSVLLSHVLGAEVQNKNVETVGKAEDVAVNLGTARVDYVLLSLTGEAVTGTRTIPVPWSAFSFTDSEGDKVDLILNLEAADLEAAPDIDLSQQAQMDPSDWESRYGQYWNPILGEAAPNATPAPEVAGSRMAAIVLAKKVMTTDLTGTNNVTLGKITDFLIERGSGRISYLLISSDQVTGTENQSILIPIPADLTKVNKDLSLQLPFDLETLKQAPNFDLKNLPDLRGQEWENLIRQYWQSLGNP